jgi:hypothetical protein
MKPKLIKKHQFGGNVGVSIPLNSPKDTNITVGGNMNFGKINQSLNTNIAPFRKKWNINTSTSYKFDNNNSFNLPVSLTGDKKLRSWNITPNVNIIDVLNNISHNLSLGLNGNKKDLTLNANYFINK